MKRPRKRYTSESEILSEIDALNAKIAAECKASEDGDKLADALFRMIGLVADPSKLKGSALGDYHLSLAQAKEARSQSDKLRRVQGMRQGSLLRLKATLAAYRTQPMAFMPDASVPLAGAL